MEDSKKLRQINHVMTQEMYNSTPHPIAKQFRDMGIPLDVPESLPITLSNAHNEFKCFFGNNEIDIIFDNNGIAWFKAYEIAKMLGYSNVHNMTKHLPDNERCVQLGRTAQSGPYANQQEIILITEYGLYRIIMRASSKKPDIIKFQNWVFYEVLPSIRKYGAYMDTNTITHAINNQCYVNNLINALIDHKHKISELENQNNILNNQISDMTPYASTGEFMIKNIIPITIEELSKILNSAGINIGRNRLFELLREEGYLMKTGNDNRPTQKSLNAGLMTYMISPLPNGKAYTYIYVLPKGINYFINKYKDLK